MIRIVAVVLSFFAFPLYASGDFAITRVTVIPMDEERVLSGHTVIVRDGRIAELGPTGRVAVPEGMTVVDGRGKYLLPGLAEMHAHVPPQADQSRWTQDVLFLYVANGITFARSMLGAPHHIELRERVARGEVLSPRLYLSGPSFGGSSVASPEAGREMVAAQQAAGYDFMKIHPGLDVERFDAIADEARARGFPFAGHVSHQVGIERALAAGQATVDHLDAYMQALVADDAEEAGQAPMFFGWNLVGGVDEAKIPVLARLTREAGVWNVPTESLMYHVLAPEPDTDTLAAREELRYVPRVMAEQWVQARRNLMANPQYDPALVERFIEVRGMLIKALHDEGAGLLLGSDAPQIFNVPGFAIHHELAALVAAGLTPWQALETGTRNIAVFLGEEDESGTIAVGMRADLVLFGSDPLADIGNTRDIAGVSVNGRWVPREEIDAGLARIAARYR